MKRLKEFLIGLLRKIDDWIFGRHEPASRKKRKRTRMSDKLQEIIDEAINCIKEQVCDKYGVPENDDADEQNHELAQFIVATTQRALAPLHEYVRRLGDGKPASASEPDARFRTIEAKLDRLLATVSAPIVRASNVINRDVSQDQVVIQAVQPEISVVRTTIARKSKSKIAFIDAVDTSNLWGQYQKVWNQMKATKGEPVPAHAGERSKMCSADYNADYKKMPQAQQLEWLQQWTSD